jgi:hypothetical protein
LSSRPQTGEPKPGDGIALLHGIVEDDAVVVVGDLGLAAELDGLAEPALGDRLIRATKKPRTFRS